MTPADSPDSPYDVSLADLAIALLRHRDRIVRAGLIAMVVVAAALLARTRTWSATATFVPQSRRPTGSLQGLAAQFGITAPTGEAAQQSPAFYADLVTSREILGEAAARSYQTRDDSAARPLADLLEVEAPTPERRRADTIRELAERVDASVTQKTGVVNVSVVTDDPVLSRQIADAILEGLNRFNMQIRQSQASAERRFTEQRLTEVRADLRRAEDDLQAFLQRNREYQGSAELRFQQDRLARVVTMQQQIYSAMAQAYEQAKLEEVRDTPLLTVIVRPEAPAYPNRRNLATNGILAFLLAALAAAVVSYLREAPGIHDPDALRRLRGDAWSDVTHPFRTIRRLLLPSAKRASSGS